MRDSLTAKDAAVLAAQPPLVRDLQVCLELDLQSTVAVGVPIRCQCHSVPSAQSRKFCPDCHWQGLS